MATNWSCHVRGHHLILAMLVVVLMAITGCATLLTRSSDVNYSPMVFPSTRGNFVAVNECFGHDHSGGFSGFVCIPAILSPFDLPLAFATDTIMLPFDGYRSFTKNRNQTFWDTVFAQNRIDYPAEDYVNHTEWVHDYIKQKLSSDRKGVISSEIIELIYSLQPHVITYNDIQYHPNLTPKLLDKIATECSTCDSEIAENGKTSAQTLERMYTKSNHFYTRGIIVDNPNAPDRILIDFIDRALQDTDKQNRYWAVAGIKRITPSLLEKLSKDTDPLMRYAVASNYYTPMPIISSLLNDTEKLVRDRAEDNLRLREGFHKDMTKRYGVSIEPVSK